MSFVVVVSTSSVLFTPPTGSENAFAGQTIASATWNSTFTDLCNNGLAIVGKAGAPTIKGNNSGAVGVVGDLSPGQVGGMIGVGLYAFASRGVNFNQTGVDVALSVSVPTARYMVDRVAITNASQTLTTSAVALFTAAGGTGIMIISSAQVSVSSSLADTPAGATILPLSASISSIAFSDATLQFRLIQAQGAAATADVILYVRPM